VRGQSNLAPTATKPTCAYDDCHRKVHAKSLCSTHYKQLTLGQSLRPIGKRGQRPKHRRCSFDDCSRPHWANGLCASQNKQAHRGQPLTPLLPRRPEGMTLAEVAEWILGRLERRPDGCWTWPDYTAPPVQYPQVYFDGQARNMARIVLEAASGPPLDIVSRVDP